MKLRRLNTRGINQMETFLDSLGTDTPDSYPSDVLTSPETSEAITTDVEIEKRLFQSRLDVAKYLDERLGDSGLKGIQTDKGIWAWLALFFYEQLCMIDKNGHRKPGERSRWIPAFSDARRYYRHLLYGPYRIYRANRNDPSRAMILLYGPLNTVGAFVYQIASRQEYVTNKAVLELATDLYFDADRQKPKEGSQTNGKPGTIFRFVALLNQLDRTWDLYSMNKLDLIGMLPSEFDPLRNFK